MAWSIGGPATPRQEQCGIVVVAVAREVAPACKPASWACSTLDPSGTEGRPWRPMAPLGPQGLIGVTGGARGWPSARRTRSETTRSRCIRCRHDRGRRMAEPSPDRIVIGAIGRPPGAHCVAAYHEPAGPVHCDDGIEPTFGPLSRASLAAPLNLRRAAMLHRGLQSRECRCSVFRQQLGHLRQSKEMLPVYRAQMGRNQTHDNGSFNRRQGPRCGALQNRRRRSECVSSRFYLGQIERHSMITSWRRQPFENKAEVRVCCRLKPAR
jgi:hypothetical protein